MAKFRKRPVVIEAFVPKGDRQLAMWPNWAHKAYLSGDITFGPDSDVYVKTLEGIMRAAPGDWIIKGVNGEIYPCKPDIFEKTYEPVED